MRSKKCTPYLSRMVPGLTLLFLCAVSMVSAKTYKPTALLVSNVLPIQDVEKVTMPPLNNSELIARDMAQDSVGVLKFAEAVQLGLDVMNSGTVGNLQGGEKLIRLRVASAGALSLNLGFSSYYMPPGGKLFIYTPDFGTIVRPFTSKDNETHGELWTPIVLGDEIVIEVTIPEKMMSEVRLVLGTVNHGYVEPSSLTEKSGACNLDVVCSGADGYPEVDAWRDEIRSVAAYGLNGTLFCTGSLTNNTANDHTPYFLTANHCGINASNAASVVVYWNYENSTCRPVGSSQAGDGTLDQFNTGSFFRAGYLESDFTLVELDDPIDSTSNVFYAGWDRRDQATMSAVAIHHPNVDEKRISFENDPTLITSYLQSSGPGDGSHIRVADWDVGTTEPGSSGSPLFSPDGLVIGQLHGGYAACGNNTADWYGRLTTSWQGGGGSSSGLMSWLDPVGSGALTLDGLDSGSACASDSYEPDDSSAQASTIASGVAQVHSICPAGDEDWTTFTLTSASEVVIETSGMNADTRMWLYDSSLNLIEFNDDSGTGLFSGIDRICGIDELQAGTYYIKVDENGGDDPIGSYNLSFIAFSCAGGTPTLTVVSPDGGETLTKCVEGTITWSETNVTGETKIELYKGGTAPGNMFRLISAGEPMGTTSILFTPPGALPNGNDYYVAVSALNGSVLDFSDAPFSIVDEGFCSGCSADGYEPDDTSAEATALVSGVAQTHSICPTGDEDWTTFTLTTTSGIILETSGVSGDTRMWLYDSNLTLIEYNDDFGGLFSRIDRICGADPLAEGTYYVKIDEYGDNNPIDSYDLLLTATECRPDMSAVLRINDIRFATDGQIVISTVVNNYTASDIVVDAELKVVLPDNSVLTLSSLAGVTIPGGLSNFLHTLYDYTFNGMEPVGTYTLSFTVRRTSDQILLSDSEVEFAFAP